MDQSEPSKPKSEIFEFDALLRCYLKLAGRAKNKAHFPAFCSQSTISKPLPPPEAIEPILEPKRTRQNPMNPSN